MSQQYVPGISASSRSGFEGVVHEAEEYSVSTSESSSNSSYYGIGYLSGRWIQYLGEVALRGAERMGTAVKLRNIEHELKHEVPSRWRPQTMEALLEFQRVFFVYADGVRRKAWDLIFFAMEKKGWEPLVVTIESWSPQYNMEKRWFVQQLAICKLSGWSSHPVRERINRPVEPIFQSPRDVSSSKLSALSDSFFRMLLYFLERDAIMLHETFHLDSFTRLLADKSSQKIGIHVALALFFDTFAAAHPFPDIPSRDALFDKLPEILNANPTANCLIQYLCTTPDVADREGNLAAVVGHILDSVQPFAAGDWQQESIVRRRHPYLNSSLVVNPTWPFLSFSVLLTWQCADATHLLINHNFLKTLDDLIHRYKEEKNMCYLMIALLNAMGRHYDLSRCKLKANLEGWSSGQPRRRSSAARKTHIPSPTAGSSVASSSTPLTSSPRPIERELPSDPSPPYSLEPTSERDPSMQDPDSTSRRFILADAMALAQRAVSLDKRQEVEMAVVSYAASAELLVEFMALKVQHGRVSQSAKLVRGIYDTYMARIDVLCRSRGVTAPPVSRPPRIPTSANSMLPHQNRSGSVSMPVPLEVAGDPTFMRALQDSNNRLFEVWRSDMIPRP